MFIKRIIKYQKYLFSSLPTKRLLPVEGERNILITAALPYVNNTPHLGNIIGGVLSADVYARYCRLRGYNTLFVCGTDEYGTTTEVKAIQEQTSPQQICDKFYLQHKGIYEWFRIGFDYFGRTSSPIHTEITTHIFNRIAENGKVEKRISQQYFCEKCKIGLADRYIKGECTNCGAKAKGDQCDSCSTIFKDPIEGLKNPQCSVCGQAPVAKQTEHLYFTMSAMSQSLNKWLIEDQGMRLWTNNARAVTKAWLNNKLQDRCITRDLKWGVPVPSAWLPNKVFYVWFEAPIGYISMTAGVVGENWKKWWHYDNKYNVELNQFMGKDNIVFHSTMAPATLMASEQNFILPHRLSVTEYLLYEGGKFSKSNNIGIFGDQCKETQIKSDTWRYYLLSNRPETYDSQFTWADLAIKNNKELMNVLGNMCNRIFKYTHMKLNGKVPPFAQVESEVDREVIRSFGQAIQQYCLLLEKVEIKLGAEKMMEMAEMLNKYLQVTEFWKKSHVQSGRSLAILGLMFRIVEFYAVIMVPYLPETSGQILQILKSNPLEEAAYRFSNQNEPWQSFKNLLGNPIMIAQQNQKWQKRRIDAPRILFNEITAKKVEQLAGKFGIHRPN